MKTIVEKYLDYLNDGYFLIAGAKAVQDYKKQVKRGQSPICKMKCNSLYDNNPSAYKKCISDCSK